MQPEIDLRIFVYLTNCMDDDRTWLIKKLPNLSFMVGEDAVRYLQPGIGQPLFSCTLGPILLALVLVDLSVILAVLAFFLVCREKRLPTTYCITRFKFLFLDFFSYNYIFFPLHKNPRGHFICHENPIWFQIASKMQVFCLKDNTFRASFSNSFLASMK